MIWFVLLSKNFRLQYDQKHPLAGCSVSSGRSCVSRAQIAEIACTSQAMTAAWTSAATNHPQLTVPWCVGDRHCAGNTLHLRHAERTVQFRSG